MTLTISIIVAMVVFITLLISRHYDNKSIDAKLSRIKNGVKYND